MASAETLPAASVSAPSAIRHNPALACKFRGLAERGKPGKVAEPALAATARRAFASAKRDELQPTPAVVLSGLCH